MAHGGRRMTRTTHTVPPATTPQHTLPPPRYTAHTLHPHTPLYHVVHTFTLPHLAYATTTFTTHHHRPLHLAHTVSPFHHTRTYLPTCHYTPQHTHYPITLPLHTTPAAYAPAASRSLCHLTILSVACARHAQEKENDGKDYSYYDAASINSGGCRASRPAPQALKPTTPSLIKRRKSEGSIAHLRHIVPLIHAPSRRNARQ